MDKATKPDGSNASPWPEESGSEQGFGATGVFQVVKTPEAPAGPAPSGLESFFPENRAPEPARPLPPPAPRSLAEPVVHKVVFGAGAESSPELLDRMRLASAERAPLAEKVPAAGSGGAGSGGFTELLRTLGSDSAPPPPPPAQEAPAPARPAPPSGFTSLLQTLNAPEAAAPPVRPVPEQPRSVPAASGSSGFTELLRTTGGADAGPGASGLAAPGPGEAPFFAGAAGAVPPAAEGKPGAFTQLFGTFGSEASAPAPAASERGPAPSAAKADSFTRMLSLEPQPPAREPAFQEERKPLPGSLNYGVTPGMAGPAAPVRDPFAAPAAETPPEESTPPGSGVGITRLIQMLDEPSRPPAVPVEAPRVSPPLGKEPGAWTQTFASLSTPSEPAPAARAPAWASPPPSAAAAPPAREVQFPGGLNEPVVHPAASGPSEFTRILDASRMREMAMRGGAGAANLPQAPLPQAPPPPAPAPFSPPAMPSYPLPAAPPMGGMPGMGAMPQPGVYPPPLPQPPAYPMSYAPPAAVMPAAGAGLPQPPGMYAPAPPPMPAAPQALPVKPPDAAPGKLQQLVPVLLVVIIVLLIALLVTVIFLMKH
ncbi:MAG: hypothetical protein ABR924_00105 [Terracidiphilus sp.]